MNKKPYKVVIFNATMRSGKDVAAKHMLDTYGEDNINLLSFKSMLINATAKVLDISEEDFLDGYDATVKMMTGMTNPPTEWYKDLPMYPIGDTLYSKRTALIHVSENVLKKLLGDSVFGDITASNLVKGKINILSDGGFDSEFKPLLEVADVLVLKRDRLNTNWEGDSRFWLSEELGGTHKWCPDSVTELEEFLEWTEKMIKQTFDPQWEK